MRAAFKSILLLLVTVFVTLFVLELAVGWIGFERTAITALGSFHEPDADLGWKLIPN